MAFFYTPVPCMLSYSCLHWTVSTVSSGITDAVWIHVSLFICSCEFLPDDKLPLKSVCVQIRLNLIYFNHSGSGCVVKYHINLKMNDCFIHSLVFFWFVLH